MNGLALVGDVPRTTMSVQVLASDEVLRTGVEAALRDSGEITLATTAVMVTVIVVDAVDDEALGLLRQTRGPALLVVSAIDAAGTLRAIQAGVAGVVRRRGADAADLTAAVRAVSNGHGTMPPDLLGEVMDRLGTGVAAAAPTVLDDREKAVLRMVADGHETAEIARALAYSPRTVTGIVHDITRRLRLRNRAHAVAFALRHGLI